MALIARRTLLVLNAVRGALGFLSRLPVGRDEAAWEAFRRTPASFPLAGYVIGVLVALPVVLPAPAPTVAFAFLVGVYLVTGINHVDGVTDLGDALVVHGDAAARRDVLKDTPVGVGGALAAGLVVFGLGTAGLAFAALPPRAAVLVVTAEVGAKLGVAGLVGVGSAAHEGLGSALTSRATPRSLVSSTVVALPAVVLAWPRVVPGVAVLLGAIVVAIAVGWWARANLGGVSGDVLGAANELARVVALHVGVIAWTHF